MAGSSRTQREESVPDVLGEDQRAQMVAEVLAQAQGTLMQLACQQAVNDHDDDESIPGMAPLAGTDRVPTYGERRQSIRAGMERLMKDNEGLRERIEAVAAQARAERDRQRGSTT